ncbi:MAG: SMI1/KNR4 family protein [Ruminococcus sp.]|nr:SMI1/KNR4 family protein [Ruminococcus sp.]
MQNNPLYEQYSQIREYCEKLEGAAYDRYKLYSPATEEDICSLENDNGVILPEELKNWYMLSNGFDMNSTADILPISSIRACPFGDLEELDKCFIVGHYIGDGSMLVIDNCGNFYEFDHGYHRLYKMSFRDFLVNWVIDRLEDNMYDAGLM